MNKTKRNLLAVAGVASTLFGIVGAIPSFLQNNYVMATLSAILMIAGIILLAIVFGE